MNKKLGQLPFLTTWFYVVMAILVTWQEYYTPLAFSDFKTLASARFLLILTAIPCAYVLRKNPFSPWANSFACLNFLIYDCLGHYYRPMYFASFIQTLYGFSFLFFPSRRLYFVLSTLKTVGFATFYILTYDLVKYPQGPEAREDFVCSVVIAYLLGLLIHHFFTAERGMKEAANDRFALLGRHASNIVHDLKGSISIPHMYIAEARRSLENKDYEKVKEYLDKMDSSLSRTEKTIFDLNQLSRMTEGNEEPFKVSEALSDVFGILAKRLHDIEININGDFELKSDRGIVCSIFLNLVLNSLESFKKAQTENPKINIQISSQNRTVSFMDNGGGFSSEALTALKRNHFAPNSTSNSGLGLYLVRENLRALKGRISFKNNENGALVDVKLG